LEDGGLEDAMFTTSDWRIGRAQLRGLGNRRFVLPSAVALGGAMVFGMGTAGRAAPKALDFESAPVTDVVAQIDKAFGANITIKPGVNADGLVTFTVPNVDNVGARLEAINDLANALNADYTKVFVIRNATDGESTTPPAVDAVEAPVVFGNTTVSAADAIRTIAAVDDASVQFYSPVSGSITVADTQMTAREAAREVARQTHTVWKAYYVIAPRKPGSARRDDGEKVIGYTAGGQPITELPISTFRGAQTPEPEPEAAPATTPQTDNSTADKSAKDKGTADTNAGTAAQPQYPYPYGYYPYPAYPAYPGYPGYGYGYYPAYGGPPVYLGSGMGVTGYGSNYNPYGGWGTGGYGMTPGGATVLGASPITLTPFGSSF
jgi:hypothetical protein